MPWQRACIKTEVSVECPGVLAMAPQYSQPTLLMNGWHSIPLPDGQPLLVWSAGPFESELASQIRKAKYGQHWLSACSLKGRMQLTHASGVWSATPLLIPIPPDPARLPARGFHLPALMAEALARRWKCPLDKRLLRKTCSSPVQAGLARHERLAHLEGKLAVNQRLDGRAVVLVDDVMTTGATLAAATAVLESSGARVLAAVVLARVLSSQDQCSVRSAHVIDRRRIKPRAKPEHCLGGAPDSAEHGQHHPTLREHGMPLASGRPYGISAR